MCARLSVCLVQMPACLLRACLCVRVYQSVRAEVCALPRALGGVPVGGLVLLSSRQHDHSTLSFTVHRARGRARRAMRVATVSTPTTDIVIVHFFQISPCTIHDTAVRLPDRS
eukprot:5089352-Prymnesium_polylepis.1